MTSMLDYLTWRGDLTFQRDPLNAVDALIFSTLAYISLGTQDGTVVTVQRAAELFFERPDLDHRYLVKNDLELLRRAAATERFWQGKAVSVPGSAHSGAGDPVCRHDLWPG